VYTALHGHLRSLAVAEKTSVGLRLYVESHNERAIAAYEKVGLQTAGYVVMEELFDARRE
jgi:ribosomal protein S18 acetylase RimI-like enzyme